MADTLSQEEVDALLKGMADGEVSVPESAATPANAQSYELLRDRRLADAEGAALVLVHERFASEVAKGLAPLIGKTPTAEPGERAVITFGGLRDRIPRGASICWFGSSRGHERGLLVVPPQLAFEIVDCMFGGPGRAPADVFDRHPSPTEVQTMRRYARAILDAFVAACTPVAHVDLSLGVASDSTVELALGNASEVLLMLEVECNLGGGAGRIALALPQAVHALLSGGADDAAFDEDGAALEWSRAIRAAIGGIEVSMAAELGRREMSARDVLRLRVGDVLPLYTRGDDPLVVCVEGTPLLRGVAGVSRGQNAVRVLNFERAI